MFNMLLIDKNFNKDLKKFLSFNNLKYLIIKKSKNFIFENSNSIKFFNIFDEIAQPVPS